MNYLLKTQQLTALVFCWILIGCGADGPSTSNSDNGSPEPRVVTPTPVVETTCKFLTNVPVGSESDSMNICLVYDGESTLTFHTIPAKDVSVQLSMVAGVDLSIRLYDGVKLCVNPVEGGPLGYSLSHEINSETNRAWFDGKVGFNEEEESAFFIGVDDARGNAICSGQGILGPLMRGEDFFTIRLNFDDNDDGNPDELIVSSAIEAARIQAVTWCFPDRVSEVPLWDCEFETDHSECGETCDHQLKN